MKTFFVDVNVEEHDDLPNGCSQRFRALDEGKPVHRVRYESESGVDGTWRVHAERSNGGKTIAMGYPVEDSSAGTSTLIVGGERGLRLASEESGEIVAEPFLLLAPSAVYGA